MKPHADQFNQISFAVSLSFAKKFDNQIHINAKNSQISKLS